MRRAAKVDANHEDVVKALRATGCTVQSLAAVGNGCPDLLVGKCNTTVLMEIKDGNKPPSKRKVKPGQEMWHAEWRGAPVAVVLSIEDALRTMDFAIKYGQ